ncbi:hypothetical protein AB4Z54_60190, partial [Streptomyces sp. MCAF7]
NQYSTDYNNFSCDHGSGMETQAKFADTIYTYADRSLLVNLFIPSELRWQEKGITWRQTTGFPDQQTTTLTVASGAASLELRVRIPSWATGARAALNGTTLPDQPKPGSWLVIDRSWKAGDRVEVTLPMALKLDPTPDDPDVQAVLYGPVVLAGAYGNRPNMTMPRLVKDSVRQQSG